jgi:hypothetical protein
MNYLQLRELIYFVSDKYGFDISSERHELAKLEQREVRTRQLLAARAAKLLLTYTTTDKHNYLAYIGHPEASGLVQEDGTLFIPMRDIKSNAVVGAQIVRLEGNEWTHTFCIWQRLEGAVYRFGTGTDAVLCIDYADGISIESAVSRLKLNYSIYVCFSQANLEYVAARIPGRKLVFTDANKIFREQGVMHVCKRLNELRARSK